MTSLRLDIQGDKELEKALRQAASDLTELKQANSDTSQIVTAAARGRAPRRTGRLAASGSPSRDAKGAGTTFTVPYANPIHWGWRARRIKPQPFAQTAAEATQPSWLKKYEDNIQDIIRKANLDG
jgi:hypothetical protein